jgi:hypothetical protein
VSRKYYFDFKNQSPTVVDIEIRIKFSRNQSESTAQIWVALLGVDKQCHEFSQTVITA